MFPFHLLIEYYANRKTQMGGFGGSEGMATILKGLRRGRARVRSLDVRHRHLSGRLTPTSRPAERSVPRVVFQQPWPVLKYKVYHIFDAKSLVSSPA